MRHRLISFLVLGLMAWGCATEPEPLDKTQPDAVNKAMFTGDWYYKLTVVDTEWANNATFIGEEAFFGAAKVRWDITEDKLNGHMVPQKYRNNKGEMVENTIGMEVMVLSFNIKGHFDIKYMENSTTREDLNVIIENDSDRPWWEREYMRVDWSENQVTNIWAPMAGDLLTGDLAREPVSVWDNVEFYDTTEKAVDTRKWNPEKDAPVVAMNIDTQESIRGVPQYWWDLYYGTVQPPVTVKWRHSLLKAPESPDYEPMDFRDDFFRRYGYFRTEYEVYDELRATRESDKRYFINRWNTDDDRQIVFTLSPSFPANDADLVAWTQEVVDSWNRTLQDATGRDDDVMVLRKNELLYDAEGMPVINNDGNPRYRYELGDMRYTFINYTTRPQNASPLGYGPSYADPDTGEIISGVVNVYGNWIDFVVTRAMDLYDLVAGNCTVDDVAAGYYFNEETGKCDAGTPDTISQSELNGQAVVHKTAEEAAAETDRVINFLTPGMMAAYYPRTAFGTKLPKLTTEQLADMRQRLDVMLRHEMENKAPLNLAPLAALDGTGYETLMMPRSSFGMALPGARSASDPAVQETLSPVHRLSDEMFAEHRHEHSVAGHCRIEPDHYDAAVAGFVMRNKDMSREEIRRELRHWIYYTTTLHELGHVLGLRHNFRGSMDRANFHPQYEEEWHKHWQDLEELREEYAQDIQDGVPDAYREYVTKARDIANERVRFSGASIMDYTGDWESWYTDPNGTPGVPRYDRAAILFGYGHKIEVVDATTITEPMKDRNGDIARDRAGNAIYDLSSVVKDAETGKMKYSTLPWKLVPFEPGDFDASKRWDPLSNAKVTEGVAKRLVRNYQFASDEKVFDDAFCTRFDSGVTATEIIRNTIEDQYLSYLFRNFKRDSTGFDGRRGGYFINKWLWTYYMMAKFLPQLQLHIMWYGDRTWDAVLSDATINNMLAGPEKRDMMPGHIPEGGEDLLRASLLAYQYMLYDVLMRPDYGDYAQAFDRAGNKYWEITEQAQDPLDPQPRGHVALGEGWGWAERWDLQYDTETYYAHLIRIGVELDKIAVLEVMSIPAALNELLWYEKANGLSFWNSLWTGDGRELWEVMRGLVTDNFAHASNPWCIEEETGKLVAQPVSLMEGMMAGGLFSDLVRPDIKTRCAEGAYPVKPGMDALFAIYPIFWSIAGASHPWYTNSFSERLDSQVKGGNHRFDIPEGTEVAEFTNPAGTKVYQAVNTNDGLSISYELVRQAEGIMNRYAFLQACAIDAEPVQGWGTFGRSCDEVTTGCGGYRTEDWCEQEGWISSFDYNDYPDGIKYQDVDRIEAMLIMAQDMIDIAGHYAWRVPGVLEDP